MIQCVPSWDLDDVTPPSAVAVRSGSNSIIAPDVPLLDYEVAELTWENGQIAMHGLGPPRVPTAFNKQFVSNGGACKYPSSQWEKPRAGGTLESIVNQATGVASAAPPPYPLPSPPPPRKFIPAAAAEEELVPWFESTAAAATITNNMTAAAVASRDRNDVVTSNIDAQVPCRGGNTYTQVASCSGAPATAAAEEEVGLGAKRMRVHGGETAARVRCGSSMPSVSGTSGTCETSYQMGLESSCGGERDFGGIGSPENESSGKPSAKAATATAAAADDHDSACHSRLQRESGDEEEEDDKNKGKSSVSTKRSRAAAIHNQSERKRRDKINQRMKTLQKLVPNSSKTDKASMLDEVIDYLKQLQAQVQMMSRMNMPAMMLPVAMQQQLQLSMMNPMGMGMGLGMGMGMGMGLDIGSMARPNLPGMQAAILHPNPFVPIPSWDSAAAADARLQPQLAAVLQDPLSSFFACQSQPMTQEAYCRMAAIYQQLHQQPASNSKS